MADEGRVGGDVEFLTREWDAESARLATRAVQAGEPTAWFETLYAGGRRSEIDMPWDRAKPLPSIRDWLQAKGPGAGRCAVVGWALALTRNSSLPTVFAHCVRHLPHRDRHWPATLPGLVGGLLHHRHAVPAT